MAQMTKRTNDLYCRDFPSAVAIEEIKHLARIKKVKVSTIVHREHLVVKALRQKMVNEDPADRVLTSDAINDLLIKYGLGLSI